MVRVCSLFIYGHIAFKNLYADSWPVKHLLMLFTLIVYAKCVLNILIQEPVYKCNGDI